MYLTLGSAVARVAADAASWQAFARFGVTAIHPADLTAALAAFQRTLTTGPTAYDEWLQGNADALDRAQKNGRFLFFTRGQCAICHIGNDFSDHKLRNVGTGTEADSGR